MYQNEESLLNVCANRNSTDLKPTMTTRDNQTTDPSGELSAPTRQVRTALLLTASIMLVLICFGEDQINFILVPISVSTTAALAINATACAYFLFHFYFAARDEQNLSELFSDIGKLRSSLVKIHASVERINPVNTEKDLEQIHRLRGELKSFYYQLRSLINESKLHDREHSSLIEKLDIFEDEAPHIFDLNNDPDISIDALQSKEKEDLSVRDRKDILNKIDAEVVKVEKIYEKSKTTRRIKSRNIDFWFPQLYGYFSMSMSIITISSQLFNLPNPWFEVGFLNKLFG